MKRLLGVAACLAMISLFAAGCGSDSGDDQPEPPKLDGTSWVLVDAVGNAAIPKVTATLAFAGSKVTGNGSCNSFGGTATITGDRIRVSELTMTLIGCESAIAEQEAFYMKALGEARSFEIDGEELVIHCYGFDKPLRFKPAP